MQNHDITLPLSHRSGTPAIIKAKLMVAEKDLQPAWVLPGGTLAKTRREAVRLGRAIFLAAGWRQQK